MRTKSWVAIIAVGAMSACVSHKPIGLYPPLKSLHEGMTKPEVRSVLGGAAEEKVKHDLSENLFFQGSLEPQISEGWIYERQGWEGHIEVYFDRSGRVIGINHGVG